MHMVMSCCFCTALAWLIWGQFGVLLGEKDGYRARGPWSTRSTGGHDEGGWQGMNRVGGDGGDGNARKRMEGRQNSGRRELKEELIRAG